MLDLGKNLFGSTFSFSQMSKQEKFVFKRDVLELLIGNKVVLLEAEKDTSLSVDYNQINSFLDENIQNIVDFEFNGSVENFEKNLKTSISEYKSQQWDEAKDLLLTEEKKRGLLQPVSVSKKEVLLAFNFYKKENPFTPESFSFSLYETSVSPDSAAFNLKTKHLSNIKDSLLLNFFDFNTAINTHSTASSFSDGLNGWWLRGQLGNIFPENKGFERSLFSLKKGGVSKPLITRLGFHLFLLEDRVGEKIKIKQLFIPLQEVSVDLTPSLKKHKKNIILCLNDPGLFDSLAIENKNLYLDLNIENLSGVYDDVVFEQSLINSNPFYGELSKTLQKIKTNSYSNPFVYKNSVFTAYKYKQNIKRKLVEEDLYNRWSFFESLALQNKRNMFIEEWISLRKKDIYVEKFIN